MANQATLNAWNSIWSRISSLLGGGNNAPSESPFGSLPIAIDSPLTIYVETTGNDNNPGTLAAPFRTIQAVINYLRKFEIKAAVTVQVGVGTFDGFILDGQRVVGDIIATTGLVASLTIKGTLGGATGLTSNAGTVTTSAAATLNDSGQNWTINELKGKLLQYTSTSGSVIVARIGSNSATQILFLGGSTPLVGSTYTILEYQTEIIPTVQTGTSASTKFGVVLVGGDTGSAISTANPGIAVQYFKFKNAGITTSGSHVYTLGSGARCMFTTCEFNMDTTSSMTIAMNCQAPNGTVILSDCLFITNKASMSYVVFGRDTTFTHYRLYMLGTGQAGQVGFSQSFNSLGVVASTSASLFESMGVVFQSSRGVVNWGVLGTFINCITVFSGFGTMYIGDSKGNLVNWPFTSAGNTNFILARGGTLVGIESNVPSGLATNDITMSTANPVATYTLAAMRALTPAAVTDTLGTVVGTAGTVF